MPDTNSPVPQHRLTPRCRLQTIFTTRFTAWFTAGTTLALLSACELQPPPTASSSIHVYPNAAAVSAGEHPTPAIRAAAIDWPTFINRAKSGRLSGTYVFHKGTYDLSSTVTLDSAGQSLTLQAEPGSLFKGSYDYTQNQYVSGGFALKSSNITFENFTFANTGGCIRSAKHATTHNITINNLQATDTHSCLLIDRYSQVSAHNWTLENITIKRYHRVAMRLAGTDTRDIRLHNFHFDGAGAGSSHCFKGGIQLLEGVNHIAISSGRIDNNIGQCGERYQQGDGIEADNKQGAPHHLTIEDVTIKNSGDANLDLKADHVSMRNITSLSDTNTQTGYKLWSYDNYICRDCAIRGNYQWLIRLQSATATFTFIDSNINPKNYYLPTTTIPEKPPQLKATL